MKYTTTLFSKRVRLNEYKIDLKYLENINKNEKKIYIQYNISKCKISFFYCRVEYFLFGTM